MRPGPIGCERLNNQTASCGRTSKNLFKITVYLCGEKDCAICGALWGAIWATVSERRPSQSEPDQAVAEGGDEPSDVVSTQEKKFAAMTAGSTMTTVAGALTLQSTVSVSAPSTLQFGSEGPTEESREGYNAYMREYMKKWRARKKGE